MTKINIIYLEKLYNFVVKIFFDLNSFSTSKFVFFADYFFRHSAKDLLCRVFF
jgi:hypothetical protein